VKIFLDSSDAISEQQLLDPAFIRDLANSARELENREKLLDDNKMKTAIWPNELSAELMIEICRLFGNLCFNNPKGRELVKSLGLLATLGTAVDKISQQDFLNTKLILVLPAFLQNFIIDNTENMHLISPTLHSTTKILANTEQVDNTGSLEDLLVVLSDGDQGALLFDSQLVATAANIIKASGADVNVDLISAMITLTEDDDKSRLFFEAKLHTVLQRNLDMDMYSDEKDEETGKSDRDLMAELFVMILGTAQIQDVDLPSLVSWLKRDKILCASAFLILGNLCTSDENAELIATPEFIDSAIETLSIRDKSVRHALLGCLRNCSVNPKSRDLLINKDLGNHLIKLSENLDDPAHTYKLVAILRLLSLCSEAVARRVGENGDFIHKLVQMGSIENQFSTALGQLNVETGRLFSTVIVKTQNPSIMRTILDKNGLPHLLSLLSSPHLVMLNQSVLPLCLLFTLDPLPDQVFSEVTPEVVNKIVNILDIKKPVDGYRMVHENVLKLFTVMIGCKNEQTLLLLRGSNFGTSIKNYQSSLDKEENKTEYQLTTQILNKLSA